MPSEIILRPMPTRKDFQNLAGQSFGQLTVIEYAGVIVQPDGSFRCAWKCRCRCGGVVIVKANNIRTGNTSSCGCLKRDVTISRNTTHGMSDHPLHSIWVSMLARCQNPNTTAYRNYGGRGITVCERWLVFENFIFDMGCRPSAKHTIERRNNDGNYEPGNVRWATQGEQTRNTRQNRMVTFLGVTKCLTDWAEDLKIGFNTLAGRLDHGWTTEKAFTTPIQDQYRKHHKRQLQLQF